MKHTRKDNTALDFLVPVTIDGDWPNTDEIIQNLLEMKEKFGQNRFLLCGPSGGWRAKGLPPISFYEELAHFFKTVKDAVAPYGIQCGWWNCLTLKSGTDKAYQHVVKSDGTEHPFGCCPLDPAFQKAFAERNARFCEIAKPAFVTFEDDYALGASAGSFGCFCKFHLDEFAKREGKYYTREELVEIFNQRTPESYALMKRWRDLRADSMVSISEAVRKAVDVKSPEIPFGLMQAGACDVDGNCTERVCRALAGPNHTPFARLHGTAYCDVTGAKNIPTILYHALYAREHIKGDFAYYHESDVFPHTRFFMPAVKMRAMESVVFSNDFDGAVFYNCQILDDKLEESVYINMLSAERERFNEINRISKKCKREGVEIPYDPFWNTAEDISFVPFWTESVARFGIPFITTESNVAFWDSRQAKYYSHEQIMHGLQKGLFLDAAAAKALCDRGYGKYLGVQIGDAVIKGNMQYDIAAKEVIKAPFDIYSKGKDMPISYFYSPLGAGTSLEIQITDPKTEVISENYTYQKELIFPAMVRFENELGGRIVIFGATMQGNRSHSLLNYRRQRLFHALLKWCDDAYIFAENQPNIYTVVNRAEHPEQDGFYGMLTLNNLGEDKIESVTFNLPEKWQSATEFLLLNKEATWVKGNIEKCKNKLTVNHTFNYCDPIYILIK